MERWKPIAGYEGLYKVSDKGQVVGVKSGRILKTQKATWGYLRVNLYKPGAVMKSALVHRLVAKAFVPMVAGKDCVNHIDEDKTNNAASNLEWCTVAENDNWGTRNERIASGQRCKAVECFDAAGNLLATYDSISEAERKTGVDNGSIWRCCNGGRRTAGGYKWIYV